MDGWTNRWTDGRTDGRTNGLTSCHGIVRTMHTRHAVKTESTATQNVIINKSYQDQDACQLWYMQSR